MKVEVNKSPLVIDGQLWQTTAWSRGMGKYTLSLIKIYSKIFGSDHITVVFNSNLEIDKSRHDYLRSIMPQAKFEELKLPAMSGDINVSRNIAISVWNKFILENFSGQKVRFLILNLFTFDYCAAFPDEVTKMFIFYDLLPFDYWQTYSRIFSPSLYFAHFKEIFEADIIFSISAAAKRNLVDSLAVDPERVINIGGAYIEREGVNDSKPLTAGRYILMPTSDYPVKNNLNAVKGFAKFNEIFGNTTSLVLTSNISEDTKKELMAYSENLIFVGNVTDEDMGALFAGSELVLTTSLSEGLGLPVLEAVAYDKPVVCSKIEVFEEFSTKALYFCDQTDPDSISIALLAAFTKKGWSNKQKNYRKILEDFNWDKSAKIFNDNMNKYVTYSHENRTRVLFIIPSPDELNNSVGQLIQNSYGLTVNRLDADYFTLSKKSYPNVYPQFLSYLTRVKDLMQVKSRDYSHAQEIIYGIDDSAVSSIILLYAIARPGIVLTFHRSLKRSAQDLIDSGYLDEKLAAKVFSKDLTNESVQKALEKLGNKVVLLKSLHRSDDKEQAVSSRIWGENLMSIIEESASK